MYFLHLTNNQNKLLSRIIWGKWRDLCVDGFYNFTLDGVSDQEIDIKRHGQVSILDDNPPTFLTLKNIALLNRLFVDIYYSRIGEVFEYHSVLIDSLSDYIYTYKDNDVRLVYKFNETVESIDPMDIYTGYSVRGNVELELCITEKYNLMYRLKCSDNVSNEFFNYFNDITIGVWMTCNPIFLVNIFKKIRGHGRLSLICSFEPCDCTKFSSDNSD